MRRAVILITGAGGEIGHGLVTRLAAAGAAIITLDVTPLDMTLAPLVLREFAGSIADTSLLDRLLAEFEVDRVYHLAALLSTRAEFTPTTAHTVNVGGTLNLLEFAQRQGESHGRQVVFVYPSSIAAYGLPGAAVKARVGRVREDEYTHPTTIVRLQQAVLRTAWPLLCPSLQAAVGGCNAPRGLPRREVPRFDLPR